MLRVGKTAGTIDYFTLPVNAAQVPASLKGTRTVFSAFHHFDGAMAKQVIQDAVAAKEPIGIFDGGDSNIIFLLLTTLLHPIAFVLFTPFFSPFHYPFLLTWLCEGYQKDTRKHLLERDLLIILRSTLVSLHPQNIPMLEKEFKYYINNQSELVK